MSIQIAGKNLATKRPVESDPSSVACSICGTEQRSSYGQCQKCGASFVDLQDLDRQLRGKQNLLFGVVAGIVAASIAAILWAAITLLLQRQMAWMAIGVGFLVGICVRQIGQGIDKVFGIAGATLALLGCVAGNLLAVAIAVSQQEAVSPIAVLLVLLTAPMAMIEALEMMSSPSDLFFYILAIWEGYRMSRRAINQAELASLLRCRKKEG